MTAINLAKIILSVAFATVATFSVNANEILPEQAEATIESSASLQAETFSQLLSAFDADKDGALSEVELSTSNNDALKIAFKNLDANEDATISEDEFSAYISQKLD
ncbi:hypothetical protein ACM9HF_17920 [Colwellia sp. RE-S-Sl-9]